MQAPLNLIRALFIAAVCAALLATCAPAAWAQEGPPVVTDPPPEATPPEQAVPEPPPPPEPPAPDPVPVIPEPDPVPPDPPADSVPPDPPADNSPPAERHNDSTTQRVDTPHNNAPPAAQSSVPAGSSDQFAPPAQLPGGGAGEDWAWTDQGDAFIVGTGGSNGGGAHGGLAVFTGSGSIATPARVPALGSRERAAHDAAQAYANGSAVTLSDGGSGLFAGLFGGGTGGGTGGVLRLSASGILAVFRLVRPDWNEAFRTSTAVWRPSAYVPPIEHPG